MSDLKRIKPQSPPHTDMIARLGHNHALPTPLLETRARDRFPRHSVARRRIRDRVQIELVQRRG